MTYRLNSAVEALVRALPGGITVSDLERDFGLVPAERQALESFDLPALVELGLHPLLALGWAAQKDPAARELMRADPLHIAILRGGV